MSEANERPREQGRHVVLPEMERVLLSRRVMKPRLPLLFALFGICALATVAHAHPGHDGHDFGWDFRGGFMHPWSGWDHLLAMLGVGWWAAQLGGRARWLVPAAFITAMAIGAAIGIDLGPVSGVEQAIAASVVTLGLLIAIKARVPVWAGATLVAAFAFFHGAAHGAEMPADAGGATFGAGFLAATVLLHAAGVALGEWVARRNPIAAKWAGGAIAACGLAMLVA